MRNRAKGLPEINEHLAIHGASVSARFGPVRSGWEEGKAEEIDRREQEGR